MKVSIITAVYNARETIENTIKSVISQSYENIEYIVIDGLSTDGTIEIISKYKDKISKFISEPDKGIYDAFNKGIKLSSGDIIGFLNADDIYAHNRVIENIVNTFKSKNVDSVYGDLIYIDKAGNKVRYWKSGEFNIENLKKGWMPPHPTFFVKRKIYELFGGYRTDFKISADYEISLRFLYKEKISIAYIPEVIVLMKTGGKSNLNLKNRLIGLKEDFKAIKENNLNGLVTLILKKISKFKQYNISK